MLWYETYEIKMQWHQIEIHAMLHVAKDAETDSYGTNRYHYKGFACSLQKN